MNSRITRNRLVIVLTLIALAAFVQLGTIWLQPVKAGAQLGDGSVRFVSESISGIVPGQKIRISLGTRPESRKAPMLWFFAVTASNNQVLFESERIEVPSGEWRFSDISRRDLEIEGEPATGRAQVRVQVFIEAPRGTKSSDLIGSLLEVINEETGETAYIVQMQDALLSSFQSGGSE